MGFFIKLLLLFLMGSIISVVIGMTLESPLAGVVAMILLALMAKNGIMADPKEDKEDDDEEDF